MHYIIKKDRSMSEHEYLSVHGIVDCKRFPFSLGQVKYFLAHRYKNGLSEAVRHVGKNIYIRVDLFEAWIEKHKEK